MAGQSLSLEELKRQNAEPEKGDSDVMEELEQDIETDIDEQDTPDGDEGNHEGEKVVESWMSVDDDAGESDDKTVPLEQHISIRQKLKSQRNDLQSEVERLKRENEKLKSGSLSAASKDAPQPPDVKQFMNEYDELDYASYSSAMSEYQAKLVDHKLNGYQSTKEQELKQKQFESNLEKSVEQVENQAKKLVSSKVISAEAFNNAYGRFQDGVNAMAGDESKGQQAAAVLIDHINRVTDGSENAAKVLYKLGIDDKARQAVFDAYINEGEAGGIIQLAKINQRLGVPTNKISQAPKPPRQIQSDSNSHGGAADAAKLQRKYNEAHKKRDTKAAFEIKRRAKAAGHDTKSW